MKEIDHENIIDTFKGKLYFCKVKDLYKSAEFRTVPENSSFFQLHKLVLVSNNNDKKTLVGTFESDGFWHGFSIWLDLREDDTVEGEMNYVANCQAPGLITGKYLETDKGFYVYGFMKTMGEKVKEGFILFAENDLTIITDSGVLVKSDFDDEQDEDIDIDEEYDEYEDEHTDLMQHFIKLKGKELFTCCQAFAIYILSRLGYKIIFENNKGVPSMNITLNKISHHVYILPSFSNRTWRPKPEIIKSKSIYILMDIHYSIAVPDVYILRGSELAKKLKLDKIMSARDPNMIIIRNVWDLFLGDSPPF